jgi:hypothetical protein
MSSNQNDFNFDDDDFFKDDDDFSFDPDDELPADIGDNLAEDMPVIEEEPEERGANRTFVVLAGLLIVLFITGLGAVLWIATRPTGPSDTELTITAVVQANLTVEAYAAQTQTQSALELAMTQTAAAWTATPSPTLSPTPTTPRPTITPTPTLDQTALAGTLNAILAMTQTAAALNATPTPPEPPSPPPSQPNVFADLGVIEAWNTQVAFATLQGRFDQEAYGTQIAFATQIGGQGLDTQAEQNLRAGLDATAQALGAQVGAVLEAIEVVDNALATAAVRDPFIATQLADIVLVGPATQTALATNINLATEVAMGTRQAIATQIAGLTATAEAGGSASVPNMRAVLMRAPVNVKAAFAPGERSALQQQPNPTAQAFETLALQATRSSISVQAALATQAARGTSVSTPAALATQNAFEAQFRFATLAAGLTQSALATATAEGTDTAQDAAVATASGLATATAFADAVEQATQSALGAPQDVTPVGVQDSIATLIAEATQRALATPPVFSTQAALATQSALATRQALIERLQGTIIVTPSPEVATIDPLLSVNQTATAIAAAFLTATAQAGELPTQEGLITPTVGFPTLTPTSLPNAGLFDDVVGGNGGGVGWLALAVIGLVGVIVVSRRMRNRPASEADEQQ